MIIELRRFFENDDIKQDFSYEFDAGDEIIDSPVSVNGYVKNSTGISIDSTCLTATKKINKEEKEEDMFYKVMIERESRVLALVKDWV